MAEKEQKRPKNNKRRRRGRGSRRQEKKTQQGPQKPAVICSICEKPIEVISTAVSGLSQGDIAHLECVVRHLEQSEQLSDSQRILYIGQGNFAVVQYRNEHKQGAFTILKRITHETSEQAKKLKQSIGDRLPRVPV